MVRKNWIDFRENQSGYGQNECNFNAAAVAAHSGAGEGCCMPTAVHIFWQCHVWRHHTQLKR